MEDSSRSKPHLAGLKEREGTGWGSVTLRSAETSPRGAALDRSARGEFTRWADPCRLGRGTYTPAPSMEDKEGAGALPVMLGGSWNDQAWFRDDVGLWSNFSDAPEESFI